MLKTLANTFMFKGEAQESKLSSRFHKFYVENHDFVRKVIYWNTRETQVDDLVQQTFLKAWKGFHKFEDKSNFRTWIYRICINVIHDSYKKNKNNFQLIEDESYAPSMELKDILDKSLLVLDRSERELFILYFKFDYTFLEISKITNSPESTTKSRIYKAKEKFIKEYEKLGCNNGR